MISDAAYRGLEKAAGPENVSREPAVLDSYAWQPFANDNPERWVFRPAAVVLPGSTREVRAVVRTCGKHGLKFKAFSTGWGAYSAPTGDGVVQVDLRRMDRILEIDEKNMYAVVEPYVSSGGLQEEAMKVGLNTHIIGAGPACSPLASATSGWGVGWDCHYMSYSARNVLGVEWVLPDGEILRLGTPGSGLGWFSGDGPGPSLRGIMRGSTGALSGLGIFTRCAVKLFNWPGPPDLNVEGILLDVQSDVPENIRFCVCVFPDRKGLDEAVYGIGEAEIGYLLVRTSVAAFVFIAAPHLMKKLTRTAALRSIMTRSLKYSLTMVLAADSREEIDYQEAVLRKIISGCGGMVMDITAAGPICRLFLINFLRNTAVPVVFRMGGNMFSGFDRNDAWDSQMDFAEIGERIKRKWIERGGVIDDMADNPFLTPYENNTWAHFEEVFQYEPRIRKQLESLTPILTEFSVAAIEKCMEPLSSTDPRLRKAISPMMGHYNRWQKRISGTLDINNTADTGMYCDEMDFDFSIIDPDLREKLKDLIAKNRWTDKGPPDR